MAVLYRINSRSEEFEEALSEAGIPYQVRSAQPSRLPSLALRDAQSAAGAQREPGHDRP